MYEGGKYLPLNLVTADGYPWNFRSLASIDSKKGMLKYFNWGRTCWSYRFNVEKGRVEARTGRKRWRPMRQIILKEAVKSEEDLIRRLEASERPDKALIEDCRMSIRIVKRLGLLPWEFESDPETELYVLDGNGLPKLKRRRYLKYMKPGARIGMVKGGDA